MSGPNSRVPFVHSNLNRVVQQGAISLRRSSAGNGAAAAVDNPPRPAQATDMRGGGPIPLNDGGASGGADPRGRLRPLGSDRSAVVAANALHPAQAPEPRDDAPIRPAEGGGFIGADPLAALLQQARARQPDPQPQNDYWRHLRYNTTGVWADAVTRATMHRQYNHAQNLPLHGIDTAMYYRQGMPPTQDQGDDEHRPRSPHAPPPSFNGMRQRNAGHGLHHTSVDPAVPVGSFSIDINRLIHRAPVEMRTFRLPEDNAFIMIETTLAKISEQDPLHLLHMLEATWVSWRKHLNTLLAPGLTDEQQDQHMRQQTDRYPTLSSYLNWNQGNNRHLQMMLDEVFPAYYKWFNENIPSYDQAFRGPPPQDPPARSKLTRAVIKSLTDIVSDIALNGQNESTLLQSRFRGEHTRREELCLHLATTTAVFQSYVTRTVEADGDAPLMYIFP